MEWQREFTKKDRVEVAEANNDYDAGVPPVPPGTAVYLSLLPGVPDQFSDIRIRFLPIWVPTATVRPSTGESTRCNSRLEEETTWLNQRP